MLAKAGTPESQGAIAEGWIQERAMADLTSKVKTANLVELKRTLWEPWPLEKAPRWRSSKATNRCSNAFRRKPTRR